MASASGSGQPPPPGGGDDPPKGGDKPWSNKTGAAKRQARASHFRTQSAARATSQAAAAQAPSTNRPAGRPAGQNPVQPGDNRLRRTAPTIEFSPGSYPVIFASGPGRATHREPVIGNLQTLSGSIVAVVEIFTQAPNWVRYTAELANAIGQPQLLVATHTFYVNMLSASLLAYAQQACFTYNLAEANLPHIPGMSRLELRLPRSILAIISQYGNFSVDHIGQRFGPIDVMSVAYAAIRAAGQMIPPQGEPIPDRDQTAAIAHRSWLPTRRNCFRARFILAYGLQAYIRENRGVAIAIGSFLNSIMPSTDPGQPPALLALVRTGLPRIQHADFDFLFQQFPATEAEFTALFEGAVGVRRMAALGLTWDNPNVGHLSWNINIPAILNRITVQWSLYYPVMQRFLVTGSSAAGRATAVGSQMQLSHVIHAPGGEVQILHSFLGGSAIASSLALAFSPQSYFCRAQFSCNVVNTTDAIVIEVATRWVLTDILAIPI